MASPMPVNGCKRARPGRRLSLRQVLDLQQIAHEVAVGLQGDFNATGDREERARVGSSISNVAKAWATLQDAKREILGKPKAGVFKPERQKPKPKPHWQDGPIGFDPSESPTESQQKPYVPTHEIRDMPGFPGAKISVPIGSPATPAVADATPAPVADEPAPPPAPRQSSPPDDGLTPLGRKFLAEQQASQKRTSSGQTVFRHRMQ
jgi:hypothetical protein